MSASSSELRPVAGDVDDGGGMMGLLGVVGACLGRVRSTTRSSTGVPEYESLLDSWKFVQDQVRSVMEGPVTPAALTPSFEALAEREVGSKEDCRTAAFLEMAVVDISRLQGALSAYVDCRTELKEEQAVRSKDAAEREALVKQHASELASVRFSLKQRIAELQGEVKKCRASAAHRWESTVKSLEEKVAEEVEAHRRTKEERAEAISAAVEAAREQFAREKAMEAARVREEARRSSLVQSEQLRKEVQSAAEKDASQTIQDLREELRAMQASAREALLEEQKRSERRIREVEEACQVAIEQVRAEAQHDEVHLQAVMEGVEPAAGHVREDEVQALVSAAVAEAEEKLKREADAGKAAAVIAAVERTRAEMGDQAKGLLDELELSASLQEETEARVAELEDEVSLLHERLAEARKNLAEATEAGAARGPMFSPEDVERLAKDHAEALEQAFKDGREQGRAGAAAELEEEFKSQTALAVEEAVRAASEKHDLDVARLRAEFAESQARAVKEHFDQLNQAKEDADRLAEARLAAAVEAAKLSAVTAERERSKQEIQTAQQLAATAEREKEKSRKEMTAAIDDARTAAVHSLRQEFQLETAKAVEAALMEANLQATATLQADTEKAKEAALQAAEASHAEELAKLHEDLDVTVALQEETEHHVHELEAELTSLRQQFEQRCLEVSELEGKIFELQSAATLNAHESEILAAEAARTEGYDAGLQAGVHAGREEGRESCLAAIASLSKGVVEASVSAPVQVALPVSVSEPDSDADSQSRATDGALHDSWDSRLKAAVSQVTEHAVSVAEGDFDRRLAAALARSKDEVQQEEAVSWEAKLREAVDAALVVERCAADARTESRVNEAVSAVRRELEERARMSCEEMERAMARDADRKLRIQEDQLREEFEDDFRQSLEDIHHRHEAEVREVEKQLRRSQSRVRKLESALRNRPDFVGVAGDGLSMYVGGPGTSPTKGPSSGWEDSLRSPSSPSPASHQSPSAAGSDHVRASQHTPGQGVGGKSVIVDTESGSGLVDDADAMPAVLDTPDTRARFEMRVRQEANREITRKVAEGVERMRRRVAAAERAAKEVRIQVEREFEERFQHSLQREKERHRVRQADAVDAAKSEMKSKLAATRAKFQAREKELLDSVAKREKEIRASCELEKQAAIAAVISEMTAQVNVSRAEARAAEARARASRWKGSPPQVLPGAPAPSSPSKSRGKHLETSSGVSGPHALPPKSMSSPFGPSANAVDTIAASPPEPPVPALAPTAIRSDSGVSTSVPGAHGPSRRDEIPAGPSSQRSPPRKPPVPRQQRQAQRGGKQNQASDDTRPSASSSVAKGSTAAAISLAPKPLGHAKPTVPVLREADASSDQASLASLSPRSAGLHHEHPSSSRRSSWSVNWEDVSRRTSPSSGYDRATGDDEEPSSNPVQPRKPGSRRHVSHGHDTSHTGRSNTGVGFGSTAGRFAPPKPAAGEAPPVPRPDPRPWRSGAPRVKPGKGKRQTTRSGQANASTGEKPFRRHHRQQPRATTSSSHSGADATTRGSGRWQANDPRGPASGRGDSFETPLASANLQWTDSDPSDNDFHHRGHVRGGNHEQGPVLSALARSGKIALTGAADEEDIRRTGADADGEVDTDADADADADAGAGARRDNVDAFDWQTRRFRDSTYTPSAPALAGGHTTTYAVTDSFEHRPLGDDGGDEESVVSSGSDW